MNAYERAIEVPGPLRGAGLIEHLASQLQRLLPAGLIPIRFVVQDVAEDVFACEIGVLDGAPAGIDSALRFVPGDSHDSANYTVALVVPTGIGAEIGGHAGDAGAAAILLGAVCDRLITHPNAVNASELNEMPSNALYVEGSVLSRLMMGTVALRPVLSNRILFVVEQHPDKNITNIGVNLFNGARAACGYHAASVLVLDRPFKTSVAYSETTGRATGQLEGLHVLLAALEARRDSYDVVALNTLVSGLGAADMLSYVQRGGEGTVNPIGGAEAMLTHAISSCLDVQSAHSPQLYQGGGWGPVGIVEPALAAEPACIAFVQCIFKGLHRSPRIVTDREEMLHPDAIRGTDISCLVTPDRCVGLPLLAALERGTRVVAVKDAHNVMRNDLSRLPWRPGQFHRAENYLEAAGLVAAFRAGVSPETLRRPLTIAAIDKLSSIAATAAASGEHARGRLATPTAPPRIVVAKRAAPAAAPTRGEASVQASKPLSSRLAPVRAKTVSELFAAQVRSAPHKLAVVDHGDRATFAELNARANRLAHHLIAHGVTPACPVGIHLERSLESIVATVGVLKTGAVCVSLDTTAPTKRLRDIVERLSLRIVLTREPRNESFASVNAIIDPSACAAEIAAHRSDEPRPPVDDDDAPAFALFTSGARGPRGIVGTQRCLTHGLHWDEHPWGDDEVLCHGTLASAIDAFWEVFSPLTRGLPVVIASESREQDIGDLLQLLSENRVTRLLVTPTLLQELLDLSSDLADRLPDLRRWISTGEPLAPSLVRDFRLQMGTAAVLANKYGMTECGACTFAQEVQAQTSRVSIGKQIANVCCHVLDAQARLVANGQLGELAVGGDGLVCGYLDDPATTALRFVPNRLAPTSGRLFVSGDLAVRSGDGTLTLAGRMDRRLNVRGKRVELDEVEAALAAHPSVARAVVVARTDWLQHAELVAYVVPRPQSVLSHEELRAFLGERLSTPMIPAAIVAIAELPTTATGKLDPKSLPEPSRADYFLAPKTATETALSRIWGEVLGVEQIGRNEYFFDLGGDSLAAMNVSALVADRFDVALRADALSKTPRLDAFALLLDRLRKKGATKRTPILPRRKLG